MAKAAEILPIERKLGLAQRVQNTPQSWYANTTDRRVNLKEILHRSCKCFTSEQRLSDHHFHFATCTQIVFL